VIGKLSRYAVCDPRDSRLTAAADCQQPDEVDLAPTMAYAFITGGREREAVLRRSGGVPGAFGPEIAIAVFPAILYAIESVGPHLLGFLSTVVAHAQEVSYFATALNVLVNVSDRFERSKKADSLPDDPCAPLKKVSTELAEELSKAGVPEEQADLIIYREVPLLHHLVHQYTKYRLVSEDIVASWCGARKRPDLALRRCSAALGGIC
jgi:hypothetical protein